MPLVTRRILPLAASALLALPLASRPAAAQSARSAAVITVGAEPTTVIPLLVTGGPTQNQDVAEQLFLHLAALGPTLGTVGDRGFEPRLARRWERRDSVTLVFELDPRARWHDGHPVTARDVVFTFGLARDRRVSSQLATLLRDIADVTAADDRHVVFRYARPYAEQLYDASYHVQILPEHLVGSIPFDRLATSDFARNPVGNGPYKWVGRSAGEYVELAANRDFFLGAPKIERLFFRVAAAPEARIDLLLSGQADAYDNAIPPLSNLARLRAAPGLRVIPVPALTLGYVLFNQRDRADTGRVHPILGDRDVRRALVMGLDRGTIVRAIFGDFGAVPTGPASQLLASGVRAGAPTPYDPAAARALLAQKGWADHDGDGILDKDGQPLALTLAIPNTSAVRMLVAQAAERQWRAIGVQVSIAATDFPTFIGRFRSGDFDMTVGSASQDPTPSGLGQSWSCAGMGGSNAGHYCNPRVDSLLEQARFGRGDPRTAWRELLRTVEDDAPAAFVYAPALATVVSRRLGHVRIRPESLWSGLWQWTVETEPGASR